MSSDDKRISTEQLLDLAEKVHVNDLTRWEGDPFQTDIGQRTLQTAVFGQTGLVLTWQGEIVYGADTVDAQRHQPDDAGYVPVVDLAKAGYSREMAQAAALAVWTNHRQAVPDYAMLAELVTGLHQWDHEVTEIAGWDGDDIDALLEAVDNLDDPPDFGDDAGFPGSDVMRCPHCGEQLVAA